MTWSINLLIFHFQTESNTDFVNSSAVDVLEKKGFINEDTYLILFKINIAFRFTISIFGMVTNSISIRAFYRSGLEDSVTIVFFSQAVFDFLHMLVAIAYALVGMVQIFQIDYGLEFEVSPIDVDYLIIAFGRMFIEPVYLLTVFLAIQRCLCVAMPLHFKGIFTRERTYVVLACICVLCFSLPLAAGLQSEFVKKIIPPHNHTRYVMVFTPERELLRNICYILFGIIFNAGNQIVVTICVIFMAVTLAKSVRFRKQTSTNTKSDKSESKGGDFKSTTNFNVLKDTKEFHVVMQVTLVCVVFLMSNIPRTLVGFSSPVEPEFDIFGQYHFSFLLSFYGMVAFEHLGSSVNFFIYYKYNSKFRSTCFKH